MLSVDRGAELLTLQRSLSRRLRYICTVLIGRWLLGLLMVDFGRDYMYIAAATMRCLLVPGTLDWPTGEEKMLQLGVRWLVWCKCGGHPWWPAVVTGTKGELKVDFGDQEFGVVKPGFVDDFQSGAFTC